MAFTDAKIRGMKAAKERELFWEDGATGLGVRVSPSGIKTFVFMYRFGKKARMMTLGRFPKFGLADAHLKVAKAKALIAKGYDPGSQWVETQKTNRESPSLQELADIYITQWALPRKRARSVQDDRDIMKRNVIPGFGHIKAKDIRKKDIHTILDRVAARGAQTQANRTLALVRKMFNFAVERDILENSPCFGIKPPFKENRRDRVLGEAEMKQFWTGLEKSKMEEGTKIALKLILVTGQRKGEVVQARWDDFNFADKVWTIKSTVAKNDVLHLIPLSRIAISLLDRLKELSDGSQWIVPSPRKGKDAHIGVTAVDHALLRNIESLQTEHFAPHDLRRTAATHMRRIGVARNIVKRIINHVERDVTAVYDRYDCLAEKREALELWSTTLDGIVTGKAGKAGADVIHLSKRRKGTKE